jgi:hypothetical protein
MSLAELIPALRSLSREEQVKLRQFLDSELNKQEESENDTTEQKLARILPAGHYEIFTPEFSAEAVAVMTKFLQDSRKSPE